MKMRLVEQPNGLKILGAALLVITGMLMITNPIIAFVLGFVGFSFVLGLSVDRYS